LTTGDALRSDGQPPATIREVALRAGVSTATVSRVLAGIGNSRPKIVAAVLAAVEELDYRPSGIARSLKMKSTQTLGLIVTDIQNPFFPELVQAADDAARALGYTMLLGSAAYDEERSMRYLDLMVDHRVDGIIVASSQISEQHWARLLKAPIPVVVVNAEPVGLPVPVIVSDNKGGSRLAVQHLVALGHRRIGYIRGPGAYTAAIPRLEGFLGACADAGLAPDATPVVRGEGQVESGERSAAALLEQAPELTAIACYNDLTAIGALRALRAAGRRVPDDVSVIGFDDIDAAAWVDPPLTTIVQQKAEMGRSAVQWLIESIAAPASSGGDAERIVLPVSLRVRGSTGPAPGTAGRAVAAVPHPGDPARHRGRLHRRAAAPAPDGTIVAVDPASAGWSYVDFAAYRLRPGQPASRPADDQERLVLVLEGRAAVRAGGHDFGVVGSRASVFDGPPPPVILVAPGLPIEIVAETEALVVMAAAPAGPVRRTAYVPPEEILVEARGTGQTARKIHHLLPPTAEAGRLIAFEVFTPGGNWSSYPPHKHDTEDPPTEARLEELYFYRFAKPRGFAFQRVYTVDRALDESLAPGDGDVVLVPFGYHPVGAPAGYDCYYLNIMAGPNRAWHFTVDPDHAWLMNWDPVAPQAAAHGEA
jgi:5-deoxy-glucuronate isomerase